MIIHLIPLRSVRGVSDLNTSEIFLNCNLGNVDLLSTLEHEIQHLIAGDCKHYKELHGYDDDELSANMRDANNFLAAHGYAGNIGNISGIQGILTDFHLLQHYRKFSQRILGTEGQWEFKPGAGPGGSNTFRLFPVPRGSFPVVIEYLPSVTEFKKPSTREITIRAFLARMKMILGRIRGKFSGGIPGPDGSTITFDGDSLMTEGKEEWDNIISEAISLGEPLGPILW